MTTIPGSTGWAEERGGTTPRPGSALSGMMSGPASGKRRVREYGDRYVSLSCPLPFHRPRTTGTLTDAYSASLVCWLSLKVYTN